MLDRHYVPYPQWGIRPVLFTINGIDIPSYSFFIFLAICIGAIIYYHDSKKQNLADENSFYIALAALLGGTIGAKIPSWIFNYRQIVSSFPDLTLLMSGRTIVGGLIGGTASVYFAKKYFKITGKRGNLFAPAVALGMAIGRIGCFLRGCCYGITTNLPIGVDFGDGVHRHPTQIYESLFWIAMFIILLKLRKKFVTPGILFKILLTAYFIFRFILEFIKYKTDAIIGINFYQFIIPLILLYLYRWQLITTFITLQKVKK